jgi:hypothetical protein
MRFIMLALTAALLFAPATRAVARAENLPAAEKQKIETLINQVRELKDAQFLRNGSSYSAENAATFLRRKWQANDSKVKSARDFIDKVASFSGTSGKPYMIRFTDGREVQSKNYLLAELRRVEDSSTQEAN